MNTLIPLILLWLAPIGVAWKIGANRNRRGWLWGLLLGWFGVIAVSVLTDLSKSEQERAKDKALGQHAKALKNADRSVSDATKAFETAQRRKMLGKYGGATLYEDGLVTPQGSCELTPDIRASVQDAGSLQKYATSRITATRLVGLGVFALAAKKKKTHTVDTRELYLLIETPQFESLITAAPDHGPRVRSLATEINNAGKQREALAAQRVSRIDLAERALATAQSQRVDVLTGRP
jgi:hypothetical protein